MLLVKGEEQREDVMVAIARNKVASIDSNLSSRSLKFYLILNLGPSNEFT